MDKTTKFILGLIAVALIGINVQMWNGKTGLIKDAMALTEVEGGVRITNQPIDVRCVYGCN